MEREELIQSGQEEGEQCDSNGHEVVATIASTYPEVKKDMVSLWKSVHPIAAMTMLLHSKSLISILFLGHLGNAQLAGGSLALSFANITGYSVIKGLSTGMEPLCCQAFGAKKLNVISQIFQRSLCLLLLVAAGISLLWFNMEPILIHLGQDRDIIEVAKIYLRFSIPELFAQVYLHPLRSFLRSQCINKPLTIATVICLILHLPINYFLVIHLDMGVMGVALASAWNTVNLDLSILIYLTWFSGPTATKPWDGLTWLSPFLGWKPLLSVALPSVVSVCLEWWWYEIMLFLCGVLQNPKANVAAMGILIQTTGLLYVFPHALGMGLSIKVGHELGACQPHRAKRMAVIGLSLAVAVGVAAFGFSTAVRSVWGLLYTTEPEVVALVTAAMPVLGLCEIGNCPQTAACGVLTGSARTKVGAKVNLVAFYFVGLPVAVVMAFKVKLGFIGLWFGLAAAQAACVLMMMCIMVRTDWTQQAKRSEELTRAAEETPDIETPLLA